MAKRDVFIEEPDLGSNTGNRNAWPKAWGVRATKKTSTHTAVNKKQERSLLFLQEQRKNEFLSEQVFTRSHSTGKDHNWDSKTLEFSCKIQQKNAGDSKTAAHLRKITLD